MAAVRSCKEKITLNTLSKEHKISDILTIRPWGMICTPCSQHAGWCWADAEQMAAEQLLLALSHHTAFSLPVKVGLFIYYVA